MSDKKKGAKPDWGSVPEHLAAGTVGLVVGTATQSPELGIAAASGVKGLRQLARAVFGKRTEARFERFEEEVFERLGGTDEEVQQAFFEPDFEEVLFQNYRRVMEAVDVAVVPALGRLTAMYRARQPDQFFRGAGRLLQDLAADELTALRQILSVARLVDAPVVVIVSWENAGAWELRYSVERANECIAAPRHPLSITVMRLLDRNGLSYDEGRNGQDLGLAGDYKLAQATIERLLDLVGIAEVNTQTTTFR